MDEGYEIPLTDEIIIRVSITRVQRVAEKIYSIHDPVKARVEAGAMGFDRVWVHDAMMGRRQPYLSA